MIFVALLVVVVFIFHRTPPARRIRTNLRKRGKAAWRAFWAWCAPSEVRVIERRPLGILQRAVKQGASIRFQAGTYYLIQDNRVTCGYTLDELSMLVGYDAGKRPRQPHMTIKLTRNLMDGFRQVSNQGESISGFLRRAMFTEIEKRREEDRLALCGGFYDGNPADLADLDEGQHAQAA